MKIKNFYIIAMIIIVGVLFWEQTKEKPNVWFLAIGVVLFFYGMMKLSSKTPSKNEDKEENEE